MARTPARTADWPAALGPHARRLSPRLVGSRQSALAGWAFLSVALDAAALTDAERAWISSREADGLTNLGVHDGELVLGLPNRAPWLTGEEPLARALGQLAAIAAEPPRPPQILGIVNVTPDSFSDGGRFLDPERAVEHGLQLVAEGAHGLDVGGESTRPGSEPVELEEELRRVVPVVAVLAARTDVAISVDTQKSAVARAALDAGAAMVNDVSAGRADPDMLPLIAERGAAFVLMHMQGSPRDMQREPRYERDVVAEVLAFLRERAAACLDAGIDPTRLVVDPGIGFGKRVEHNLALLARTSELRSLALPVMVGPSRKSFIAELNSGANGDRARGPQDRLGGTAAAICAAVRGGAEILRVHDVRVMAEAARVAFALRNPGGPEH